MTLRYKILLITTVLLIVVFFLLYGVSRTTLEQSYFQLEKASVIDNLERVRNAIQDDITGLDSTTRDWAIWDDAYLFVQNRNSKFIMSNLVDSTFEELRLNVLLYLNKNGQIVYGKGFDLENHQAESVPKELLERIRSDVKLRPSQINQNIKGILFLSRGPLLFAAQPVLRTDQTGSFPGVLIMGRYLNGTELQRISKIVRLPVSIELQQQPIKNKQGSLVQLRSDSSLSLRVINSQTILGYASLQDVNGKFFSNINVAMPRDIYHQGQKTLRIFLINILIISMALIIVILVLIDKYILTRLIVLVNDLKQITKSADPAGRVHISGQDELTILATSINEMLAALESSRDELKYLNCHDVLTGLFNRGYFEERMHLFCSEDYHPVGLILCDIDGLKLVNDTLGSEKGDALLGRTAEILEKNASSDAIVARIGGDEFGILIPHCSLDNLKSMEANIYSAVKDYNSNNVDLPLSLSIGYTLRPKTCSDIFKEANDNMNQVKLYNSKSSRSAIVQILMKALEARDFITEGHTERLQQIMFMVGSSLGISQQRLAKLRLLAQFHDIGKVGIPDHILFKPAPLTPEEKVQMQRHCEIGYLIAQSAPDLGIISDLILKHHEWWNGSGYPSGLQDEEIPLECRLLAIVDAYDAMTNDRPYRKAMQHYQAIEELQKNAGTQFDPILVKTFIRIIEEERLK